MSSLLEQVVGSVVPGLTRGARTALPYLTALSLQGSPISGENIKALMEGGIPRRAPVLSANEIIRRLRSSGFTINRQLALRAIKATKEQVKAHEYIASLTDGRLPTRARVPLANHGGEYRYYIRVAVTGRDRFTGELNTRYVTIVSPRLMTKGQAKAEAAQVVLQKEHYQIESLSSVEVATYTQFNAAMSK